MVKGANLTGKKQLRCHETYQRMVLHINKYSLDFPQHGLQQQEPTKEERSLQLGNPNKNQPHFLPGIGEVDWIFGC